MCKTTSPDVLVFVKVGGDESTGICSSPQYLFGEGGDKENRVSVLHVQYVEQKREGETDTIAASGHFIADNVERVNGYSSEEVCTVSENDPKSGDVWTLIHWKILRVVKDKILFVQLVLEVDEIKQKMYFCNFSQRGCSCTVELLCGCASKGYLQRIHIFRVEIANLLQWVLP